MTSPHVSIPDLGSQGENKDESNWDIADGYLERKAG